MKNKKKLIFWLITIFIILSVGFYLGLLTSNNPKLPERLDNVPKTATWIGGVDGGFWYDIVSVNEKKKTYRFRIFNDIDGKLVIYADFKKDSLCDREYPLDKGILQKINYFDYEKIGLIENCELKIVELYIENL